MSLYLIIDQHTTVIIKYLNEVNINLFPEIKTHKNNVQMYQLSPNYKKEPKILHQKSLYMMGRKRELEACKALLNRVYRNQGSEIILIRGVFGSGKSLFLRKLLHEFMDSNKELKSKAL